MRVSFGSTYAIKYNYTLMKAYGYATPDRNLRTFIGSYNSACKDDDDISAINPAKKTYYIKINDFDDIAFERNAMKFKVKSKIRKVNDNEMRGAVITSVGPTNDEISLISDKIIDYERNKQLKYESYLP